MHRPSSGRRRPVYLTETSARLLTIECWYLETHPFCNTTLVEIEWWRKMLWAPVVSLVHWSFVWRAAREWWLVMAHFAAAPPQHPQKVFLPRETAKFIDLLRFGEFLRFPYIRTYVHIRTYVVCCGWMLFLYLIPLSFGGSGHLQSSQCSQ